MSAEATLFKFKDSDVALPLTAIGGYAGQMRKWREAMGDESRSPQFVPGPLISGQDAVAVTTALGRKKLIKVTTDTSDVRHLDGKRRYRSRNRF